MVRSTASTRQPPAGGPKATRGQRGLLQELRAGDREAFLRYFRQFRTPVHHVAWLLLRDETAAAAATSEALVATFRRAVLDEGGGDLEVLTYRCLLEACEAHAAADGREAPQDAGPGDAPRLHRRARGDDLRQRFGDALEGLEPSRRAALVLHDVAGLDAARSAAVLGVGEEAAAALLFRAREEFRAGLQAHPAAGRGAACRQAEEATARAVGLGLEEDELSRLRGHAAYCRTCRRTMRDWAGPGAGLALVFAEPPLPQALAAAPVFGDDAEGSAAAVGAKGGAVYLFARAGGALRSRAAAWAVAVLCLAVAAGVAVHAAGLQPLVLVQSVGPAIRLIAAPPDGAEPAAAGTSRRSDQGTAGAASVTAAPAESRPSGTLSPATLTPVSAGPAPEAGSSSPAVLQTAPDVTAEVTADAGPQGDKDSPEAKAAAKAAKAAAKTAARAATKATRAPRAAKATKAGRAAKVAKATRTAVRAHDKPPRSAGKAAASAQAGAKAARASAKASAKAGGSKTAGAHAKAGKRSAKTAAKAAKTQAKAGAKSHGHSGGKSHGHSGGSKKGG